MAPRPALKPNVKKGYNAKKITVFAEKLYLRREELQITQKELGKIIGVPDSRISAYEAGVFPTDPEKFVAIAGALNVTLDWLFGVPGAQKEPQNDK